MELKFNSDLMNQGGAIDIQFTSRDIDLLREVGEKTKAKLAEYPGVFDITDSLRGGKPEVKLAITSNAEALGLSLEQLARQVRQGFYGEEAAANSARARRYPRDGTVPQARPRVAGEFGGDADPHLRRRRGPILHRGPGGPRPRFREHQAGSIGGEQSTLPPMSIRPSAMPTRSWMT